MEATNTNIETPQEPQYKNFRGGKSYYRGRGRGGYNKNV